MYKIFGCAGDVTVYSGNISRKFLFFGVAYNVWRIITHINWHKINPHNGSRTAIKISFAGFPVVSTIILNNSAIIR